MRKSTRNIILLILAVVLLLALCLTASASTPYAQHTPGSGAFLYGSHSGSTHYWYFEKVCSVCHEPLGGTWREIAPCGNGRPCYDPAAAGPVLVEK